LGVAKLPGNLLVCGIGKHPRRRRSQRAFASGNVITRTGRSAFAALLARVSLRWVASPACGHRRLTTRSSGPRSAAAYLGR
jgi:hypothetical protein